MKRWAVFSLLLVLTACQPVTETPTNMPQAATTTEPQPSDTPSPEPHLSSTFYEARMRLLLEDEQCCIQAPAGEAYTLNFEMLIEGPLDSLKFMHIAERYGDTPAFVASPYSESHDDDRWRPFRKEITLMIEEVLPYWNEYVVCVTIDDSTEYPYEVSECDRVFIEGIPTTPGMRTVEIDPTRLSDDKRIELPIWMGAADASVYVILRDLINEKYILSFYDAVTQDRFDIALTNTAGYFWSPDSKKLGLLQAYSDRVQLINLADGRVSSYPLEPEQIKALLNSEDNVFRFTEFPNPPPVPLFATTNDPGSEDFQLRWDEQDSQAPYRVNIAYWEEWDEDTYNTPIVTDIQTGERWPLGDPYDERIALGADYSPANHWVAVNQALGVFTQIQAGDRLSIYSAQTGQALYQFEGEFWGVRLSPNGQQVLYQSLKDNPRYAGGDRLPDPAPCILTIATGESRCLRAIPRYFEGIELIDVLRFDWSADGERVFFLYDQSFPELPNGPWDGGICYFVLLTGEIQCLDEGIETLKNQIPHTYAFSPDQQYIVIRHGWWTFFSHDAGPSQLSVLGIEDGSNIHLGIEDWINIVVDDSYDTDLSSISIRTRSALLWRPAIQP